MMCPLPRTSRWAIVRHWLGSTVLGFFLCAFVVYPPHARWNEGLELGDLATWFSALATLAAVTVALRVAGRDRAERAEERNAKATVVAHGLYPEILRTMVALGMCRGIRSWFEQGGALSETGNEAIVRECRAMGLEAVGEWQPRLHELPAGVGYALMEAREQLRYLKSHGPEAVRVNLMATFELLFRIESVLAPAAIVVAQLIASEQQPPWENFRKMGGGVRMPVQPIRKPEAVID